MEKIDYEDETDINFTDRTIFLPAENTKGKNQDNIDKLYMNFSL